MSVTVSQASDWLRLDGSDNDQMVSALLRAAVSYIEQATGVSVTLDDEGAYDMGSALADQAALFLVSAWYYGESADVAQIDGIVASILKGVSAERIEAE